MNTNYIIVREQIAEQSGKLITLYYMYEYINLEVTDYYVCMFVCLHDCLSNRLCALNNVKNVAYPYARTVRYDVQMRSCVWYRTVNGQITLSTTRSVGILIREHLG